MSSDKGGEELVGMANYWSNMRHEPWEGDHVQRCLDGQEPEAAKKSRVEPNTTVPQSQWNNEMIPNNILLYS